jgi:hypothetical protein
MARVLKTALGRQINIENLILQNENVIAVGNTRVNARGDQLGPGGKVIKTRDQIMKEYYALNTPVATEVPVSVPQQSRPVQQTMATATPAAPKAPPAAPIFANTVEEPIEIPVNSGLGEDTGPATVPVIEPSIETVISSTSGVNITQSTEMRGSLASAVAKDVVITQTPLLPPNKANGIQRF